MNNNKNNVTAAQLGKRKVGWQTDSNVSYTEISHHQKLKLLLKNKNILIK